MEKKYTIRVESSNPEFDVPETLQMGVQADGFLLLALDPEEAKISCMQHMTLMQLAEFFALEDQEVCSLLRQSAVIGDALCKAREIHREYKAKQVKSQLFSNILGKKFGLDIDDKE